MLTEKFAINLTSTDLGIKLLFYFLFFPLNRSICIDTHGKGEKKKEQGKRMKGKGSDDDEKMLKVSSKRRKEQKTVNVFYIL